jgi:hypothetical protein
MIARSRTRTADIRRDRWSELQEPPPDRLVGCVNASLGQQFLEIPKGQCEPGIEPDRVADDFWREAVALKRYRSHPMMLIGDEPQSYPSYRVTLPPRAMFPPLRKVFGLLCHAGSNEPAGADECKGGGPATTLETEPLVLDAVELKKLTWV